MVPRRLWCAVAFGIGLLAADAARAQGIRVGGTRIRARIYGDYVLASANPRDEAQVSLLWRQAEHVLAPHDPALGRHSLAVTRATVERLRQAGIDVAIEAGSVQ